MPRHPPHAVWTPQQTNALLRIHSEEHASWVERGRPWGGYVFKNVATRLNAIPNLFPEPRTEMQCRMKLYSLKRARETSERRASEKHGRNLNWKQTNDHGSRDSSGESPRDMHSKENTIRFDTEASANPHDNRAHKRLRYHNHPSQRESIHTNGNVTQMNSSSVTHPFGNPHPTMPAYMNYASAHSSNATASHGYPPLPPPPPPSSSSSSSHPLPSPSYMGDTRGYLQSTPYYNHGGYSSYPHPHPPPPSSGHPPPEWGPPPPPPSHTIVSPTKARFMENYPTMSQTPQHKIRSNGEFNIGNYSAPSKLQSRHSDPNNMNKEQQQHPIASVPNKSISPNASPVSKVSHPEYNSASPNVPASLPPMSTSSTPARSPNNRRRDTASSTDNNDSLQTITDNVKNISQTRYDDSTPYAISPMSDKGVETVHSTTMQQGSSTSEQMPEHDAPLTNGKASSHESYEYADGPPGSIPSVSPRYYPSEVEQHAGPTATPFGTTAYPPGSRVTPQDNPITERYWTETVRMQRELERIQIELFDRNRRELFAYMERQREANHAQEQRRWRRLIDLDMAREKKFCEREEKLIATLEAADTRRENQLREFERRMREEAEARDIRWEKMLTTITREQSKNYARIYEMLASYNLDSANDKSNVELPLPWCLLRRIASEVMPYHHNTVILSLSLGDTFL
ncbi:hypothetical protein BDF22DRAFT_746058 [Syncephalis plumigaleata]|nr:hypothetical protein BDF22DRAFT_746058 [Syncephalis plumigaleata]